MTHGSLFSGIGGFDLAAEWMGWENIFHCEWNEFGQKILKHYWPKAKSYGDITKTDFTIHGGQIDILTGGFPCQPYSLAGKRKGKEDDRHLWPEMLRAIREIQPRWVVGENVFGLINWSGGLVFHEVQADLEAAGYEVWPYVLPAVSVNAPHRRDRVWFVAYRNCGRLERTTESGRNGKYVKRKSIFGDSSNPDSTPTEHTVSTGRNVPASSLQQDAPNPNSNGQFGGNSKHEVNESEGRQYAQRNIEQITMHTDSSSIQGKHLGQERERKFNRPDSRNGINGWQNFPTQPPICTGNDGFPSGLDGITFSKWRQESIKGGGNAVVPQVVYQIFKAIEEFDRQNGEHIF